MSFQNNVLVTWLTSSGLINIGYSCKANFYCSFNPHCDFCQEKALPKFIFDAIVHVYFSLDFTLSLMTDCDRLSVT